MTYCIYEWLIPQLLHPVFQTDSGDYRLRRLSRLNVFIGPNNAGKSRLLRELFSTNEVVFAPHSDEAVAVRKSIDTIASLDLTKTVSPKFSALMTAYQLPLQRPNGTRVDMEESAVASLQKQWEARSHKIVEVAEGKVPDVLQLLQDTAKRVDRLFDQPAEKIDFKWIYIPTLRGLRSPHKDKFYFRQRTVSDYFEKSRFAHEMSDDQTIASTRIFTGLEIFDELQNYLLGTLEQRDTIARFEEFLSSTFFSGKRVSLIPRKSEGALHVKIGDEAEQPIWRLGDGIQQSIILTLPIFLHSTVPLLLFVEEPELFLHPGFQRVWIETVLNSNSNLQVFVATHSHQFMDITVDSTRCSIYKFSGGLAEGVGREREARHHVHFTSNSDFSVLRELGVRNSSVLLSNCTIWVEGITDRLYLRKYLDIFQADESLNPGRVFIEDLHYSFVEYGGSAITHFSFLDEEGIDVERLCGELFLVADHDTSKEERHKRLKAALGDRCWILGCVEVENLVTPEVLQQIVNDYEGGKAEFNVVKQEDYREKHLGRFIEEHLLASKTSRRSDHPYWDSSDTVKDKQGFCARAIRFIQSRNQMSSEAVELTKAIHAHITKHNSTAISGIV